MKILASPASVIPSPLGPDHLADLEVLGGLKNFGPSLGTYRNNEKLISPSCHFAASFAPRGVLFGVGPDRGDAWADTTTPAGKLMLTLLGGLAEYERHLILTRTAEGRTRAQAAGVRFGRKPSLTAYQRAEALRRRAAGETLVEIARSFNVSHMTIARLMAQ